ncbi:MAG: GTP 3',8-cyclase MoaA [Chthoniobacterales bacterium]
MSGVRDLFDRPLRDLRVSVTDRCNLRCDYCMPAEVFGPDHAFVPRAGILTFEEIVRVVRAAAALGARKVRLTGGEPLLRRNLPALVRLLAAIRGVEDLALTTNGLLLAGQARELQEAGLHRVTVSLDAWDEGLFRRLTGSSRPVGDVLDGMRAAARSGLGVKVNCVVQRGVNEDEVLPLASLCREEGWVLRFIEFMDVGNHNRWERAAVVPSAVLRDRLQEAFGLVPAEPARRGEVARRYCYADGCGEVGFVSSITEPFCRDCNRARLTADGRLVTCLFAAGGPDLRSLLRDGTDDHALALFMRGVWEGRADRYSELRAALPPGKQSKVEMSYVGG